MQPVEELRELNEVYVRGALVANAVIATEHRVFRHYNRLNKDNRFDVQCGDMQLRLNRDTLALKHTCVPEFLSRYAPVVHYLPTYGPSLQDTTTYMSNGEGFRSIQFVTQIYYTAYTVPGSAPPVPATLRAEFAQNMQRVMGSDPALQEMAGTLARMYQEMDRTQAHYLKLRQDKLDARSAKRAAARERARARGSDIRPPHPREL